MISSGSLRMGRAAEYLVVADLLLSGFEAFPSDQGLPFDVVVEVYGTLKRIQVKATTKVFENDKNAGVYRFEMRSSSRSKERNPIHRIWSTDYYAFVALDKKKIAYFYMDELFCGSRLIEEYDDPIPKLPMAIELKTKDIQYTHLSKTGNKLDIKGRFIEDHSSFKDMLDRYDRDIQNAL